MLCFTWTVGNAEPNEAELEHWFPVNGGDYDLVVVGKQATPLYQPSHRDSVSCTCVVVSVGKNDNEKDEDTGLGASLPQALARPRSESCVGPRESTELLRLSRAWGGCQMVTPWEERLVPFVGQLHLRGETPTNRDVHLARVNHLHQEILASNCHPP